MRHRQRIRWDYAIGELVAYRSPYAETMAHQPWSPEPWRIIGQVLTNLEGLPMQQQYVIQRAEGIDAYSWALHRPEAGVFPRQLKPWKETR